MRFLSLTEETGHEVLVEVDKLGMFHPVYLHNHPVWLNNLPFKAGNVPLGSRLYVGNNKVDVQETTDQIKTMLAHVAQRSTIAVAYKGYQVVDC